MPARETGWPEVTVPTLYAGVPTVRWLGDLAGRLTTATPAEVAFDFRGCRFLCQSAIAVLGAVIRTLADRGVEVNARFASPDQEVRLHLQRNGFLPAFGLEALPPTGHAVRFREDRQLDKDGLMEYLVDQWIGIGWISVSPALSYAIAGRVCEIYMNALEHSESSVGVVSCGQHYGTSKALDLAAVDLGIGIAGSVRRYFGNPTIRAPQALRWAFTEGRSTKQQSTMRRGLGLGLLKDFVALNGGHLDVFSNEGRVRVTATDERYETERNAFPGTLVYIRLRCDARHYRFAAEDQAG